MAKTKTPADRLRDMFDSERISSIKALALLEELGAETVRAWAEKLTDIADQIDTTRGDIEQYQDATGRDEKADAKDTALDSIETLLAAILVLDDSDELPDIPNLCETPAMFEIVRKSSACAECGATDGRHKFGCSEVR